MSYKYDSLYPLQNAEMSMHENNYRSLNKTTKMTSFIHFQIL